MLWFMCLLMLGVAVGFQTECRNSLMAVTLIYLCYMALGGSNIRRIDNQTEKGDVSTNNDTK